MLFDRFFYHVKGGTEFSIFLAETGSIVLKSMETDVSLGNIFSRRFTSVFSQIKNYKCTAVLPHIHSSATVQIASVLKSN